MASNAQPRAIAAAAHDAVVVWVARYPPTLERVLRAIKAEAQLRRDGERVVYGEEILAGIRLAQWRRGLEHALNVINDHR